MSTPVSLREQYLRPENVKYVVHPVRLPSTMASEGFLNATSISLGYAALQSRSIPASPAPVALPVDAVEPVAEPVEYPADDVCKLEAVIAFGIRRGTSIDSAPTPVARPVKDVFFCMPGGVGQFGSTRVVHMSNAVLPAKKEAVDSCRVGTAVSWPVSGNRLSTHHAPTQESLANPKAPVVKPVAANPEAKVSTQPERKEPVLVANDKVVARRTKPRTVKPAADSSPQATLLP